MRYWGQNYEQDVPVLPGEITPSLLDSTLERFHRLHEEFYGYSIAGEVIELIRFNVTVSGRLDEVALPALDSGGRSVDLAAAPTRPVSFPGAGYLETHILRREELPPGFAAEGPLIVEEVSSTTVVHPGQRLAVDRVGIMTIRL
jgi:N-methylhydantoinase A